MVWWGQRENGLYQVAIGVRAGPRHVGRSTTDMLTSRRGVF
jgi:hypothetical protein